MRVVSSVRVVQCVVLHAGQAARHTPSGDNSMEAACFTYLPAERYIYTPLLCMGGELFLFFLCHLYSCVNSAIGIEMVFG